MPGIALSPSTEIFLPHNEVPQQNLLRLKPGNRLTWAIPTPRCVVRVGYRLCAKNFKTAVEEKMRQPEVAESWRQFCGTFGVSPADVRGGKLVHMLSYALCSKAKLGGPDRGIIVDNVPRWPVDDEIIVEATRCVHVGVYYPPSYGRRDEDGDDYEPGGLQHDRTVILVQTYFRGIPYWLISGDLRRLPEEDSA